MKGTICYILSFISGNPELKVSIEQLGWKYFFNSDICFPVDMKHLYLDIPGRVDNSKIFDDLDKLNRNVSLDEVKLFFIFQKSNEIYTNIANLLNTISYKQSYEKLNEMFKSDSRAFADPHLLVKLYSILATYKYRQPLRRYILFLLENALSSQEIMDYAQKIIENIGENLF